MAPSRIKKGATKGASKRSTNLSGSGSSAKSKKPSGPKPKPVQQKSRSAASTPAKKKPPHMRYSEKDLKIPKLNGIVPAGVSKPPNAKKGKNFVDDKDQMNAILAMVMAEKEGNIESKMMRARQLEEVREARRAEAEKRAEGKKAGLEDRKQDIKNKGKKRRSDGEALTKEVEEKSAKKSKKKVSFG
ncbi:60S ribosomal subunit assembly/export protein LOC1 [Teratosphaeria destructans]|uniref:60S ribosomal subunit assembly/export protein LOC1 n=1 Tax=Teratosphaeria destructans TaxID=418781 RepID=A0A9W7SWK9_9PEZI|nr:60S ribosomal subunit assembly/export protein LOC1 [Teratosphaeria destructans]